MSLFSGCGGLDLGFFANGYACKGAFDNNQDAVRTHNENFGSHCIKADLTHHSSELESIGTTDIVIAGPPCQGFSLVGKRNLDDPRNSLLPLTARIALMLRARVVVIENVMGVLSGSHRQYWDHLVSELVAHDYCVIQKKIDATDFGVAQRRLRVILIAFRKPINLNIDFPIALTTPTLESQLQDIPEFVEDHEPIVLNPKSMDYRIAQHISQGQKLCDVRGGERAVHTWDIPEVFGRTTKLERQVLETIMRTRRRIRKRATGDADPVSQKEIDTCIGYSCKELVKGLQEKGYLVKRGEFYDLARAFNGKYRRLTWQQPSSTVDSKFTNPKYVLHPSLHRGLSIREAARIQGFPDDYIFTGSSNSMHQQVGNAVPPPVGYWFAKQIRENLLT